jgi:pyruvate dehydrogenase E2 component (dihydrolipoamide acetyltransferase)
MGSKRAMPAMPSQDFADTSSPRRRGRVIASPRARRAMRQRGVDAAMVRGTGPGGRILEGDVLRAASDVASSAGFSAGGRSYASFRATLDATTLVEVCKQASSQVEKAAGIPLRTLDLVVRAVAMALGECPEANLASRQNAPSRASEVNVGFEIVGQAGKAISVIRQADRLSLVELVRARAEGASQSRGPESLSATSVIDLTESWVDECAPAIPAGQSSVATIGRLVARPWPVENRLAVRQVFCITLTTDSRLLAMDVAVDFFGKIVEFLQRPFVLLCDRPR